MGKNILLFAIIILIGGGIYLVTQNEEAVMPEDSMQVNEESMESSMETEKMMENEASQNMEEMSENDSMSASHGSYEAYAQEKIAKAADSGDVVLFFRASWCPTCRALDAHIKENLSAIPSGLTILDVDYDNSSALKQKYGVTYQHTLVQVDSDGNLIKKWNGSRTLASLIKEVE